jgi:hypothetical protein
VSRHRFVRVVVRVGCIDVDVDVDMRTCGSVSVGAPALLVAEMPIAASLLLRMRCTLRGRK